VSSPLLGLAAPGGRKKGKWYFRYYGSQWGIFAFWRFLRDISATRARIYTKFYLKIKVTGSETRRATYRFGRGSAFFSYIPIILLTLNSSKTKFLLIGLKQQLCKTQDCSLTTTHYARNLGFIFDEHLTFSDQITALSNSCYYYIRELRCIRPYLDFKTASTIANTTTHSKLDYCNSLYHNFLNCQLNRLQQIQNSLARAFVKDPKSTRITPILKSFHWLKVNERIEYKLFSLTYKVLTTAQPSYLRNLISLQPPRSTRSSSVVTLSLARQPSPPWKSQIAHLDMHHLVFGINFQIHSVSLTILVSIHLIHLSTHLYYHPHSRHPSLLHSLTPGSKPTFSTNPSHCRFLLPTRLPYDDWTGPITSPFCF